MAFKHNHTKGNWRYSEEYNLITTSRKGIVEGSKNICDISFRNENSLYNGKLIAVAPQLLECAEMLHDMLDNEKSKNSIAMIAVKKVLKDAGVEIIDN